ncbi:MAG TPA: TIGR02391 family protein [Solirubrobacterales bacterium]
MAVPPFSAAATEAVCRELGELVIGSQITGLIAPLKIPASIDDGTGTKWKRLFNAVVYRQNKQGDGRPLIRLITEIMQPVRFDDAQAFQAGRASVNRKLLLYGYEVREDGKVGKAARAETVADAQQRADVLGAELKQRNVHPTVLAFCRKELLEENYFHAVLEATKSVPDRIRELTGLTKDGAALIDEATSLASGQPILAFNELKTEWEKSEHTGLAMIAKGLMAMARNPTAHAPKVKWAVELSDALDVLTIASLLHRRLDAAII